jgi:hypothetical protein
MIIFCLLISLKITAIYVCCLPGNVLYKVSVFLRRRIPYNVQKPLFECLICMSSFWGLLFWMFENSEFNPLYVVLTVAGINAIIDRIIVHEKISK